MSGTFNEDRFNKGMDHLQKQYNRRRVVQILV